MLSLISDDREKEINLILLFIAGNWMVSDTIYQYAIEFNTKNDRILFFLNLALIKAAKWEKGEVTKLRVWCFYLLLYHMKKTQHHNVNDLLRGFLWIDWLIGQSFTLYRQYFSHGTAALLMKEVRLHVISRMNILAK